MPSRSSRSDGIWTHARRSGNGWPGLGAGSSPARRDLVEEAEDAIRTFVYGPWDPNIPTYARHLRTRMERELAREATGRRLDLKVGHGGLADIDFLLQLIQLREGAHRQEFRIAGTRALLETLPETVYLSTDQVDRLKVAYEFPAGRSRR